MTSSGLVCCAPAAPQKVRSAVKIAAWSLSMIIPPFRPRGTIAPPRPVGQWRALRRRGATSRRAPSNLHDEWKEFKFRWNEIKAVRNKIKVPRNEIQTQIIQFASSNPAFSITYGDLLDIFILSRSRVIKRQTRRCMFASRCSSFLLPSFGSSSLIGQAKGWRHSMIADARARFPPGLPAAEPRRERGNPGPRSKSPELAEKDRPIDPTSGRKTTASPSPIRFRTR